MSDEEAARLARPFNVDPADPWARIIATAVENDRAEPSRGGGGRAAERPTGHAGSRERLDPPIATTSPSYAEVLFEIARLVEQGLPEPRSITKHETGELVVMVARDDLPAWVIHFDLPGPTWQSDQHGDTIYRAARWPSCTFDALMFRIIVLEALPANPAVDADSFCRTRCAECAEQATHGCPLKMVGA